MREAAMLRKIRAGDPAGLEGLMAVYLPYVSVIVWNILRGTMSPEDGEEVVSDVFLAAWDQAADLRAGHVKGWLGAVARNKARNKLRQAGKTLPLEENILNLPDPADPAEGLTREEERVQVRRAVESLPAVEREIFFRHYYYAQTVREIAEAMELKEPTVKTKLRRGREKLKAMLTKGDEPGET